MKINLDKFELLYYLEGCARGSHLRQGVWARCIDEFYGKLAQHERLFIFHYATRDLWDIFNKPYFEDHFSCGREDFNMFLARFNPYNKYHVVLSNGDITEEDDCFYFDGQFHTSHNRIAASECIKSIEWIGEKDVKAYKKAYGHLTGEVNEKVELKPPYEITKEGE